MLATELIENIPCSGIFHVGFSEEECVNISSFEDAIQLAKTKKVHFETLNGVNYDDPLTFFENLPLKEYVHDIEKYQNGYSFVLYVDNTTLSFDGDYYGSVMMMGVKNGIKFGHYRYNKWYNYESPAIEYLIKHMSPIDYTEIPDFKLTITDFSLNSASNIFRLLAYHEIFEHITIDKNTTFYIKLENTPHAQLIEFLNKHKVTYAIENFSM